MTDEFFLLTSINSISFYALPLEISISFFRRNFIYSISYLLHLREIHYYFLVISVMRNYGQSYTQFHNLMKKIPKVKTVG